MKNMKLSLLMIVLCFAMSGCQSCQRQWLHMKSDIVGVRRQITLYSADGTVIKTWEVRAKVEIDGGTASWLQDGKDIKISGTFIIEEK